AGFTSYYPGFGRCLVAQQPLAQWTTEQYQSLAEMWFAAQTPWRQIVSPSDAHRALPVVDDLGIPVRGLFVVMILFVVLIGPVNVYCPRGTKLRIWLLWTVPVLAVVTWLLLLRYTIATDGWLAHVRFTSITVLD